MAAKTASAPSSHDEKQYDVNTLPPASKSTTGHRYVLISCVSKKRKLKKGESIEARLLYDSTLFHKAWEYANLLKPDRIFILSAKYGIIDPETKISTYDKTLKKMPVSERKAWADDVITKFRDEFCYIKEEDEVIILAGEVYYHYLLGKGRIEHYTLPYKEWGCKGIGYILSALKQQIEKLTANK